MKPILFNTEMVQAIMKGRKTATRRIVKFIPGFNPQWTGYVADGSVLYGSNNIPEEAARIFLRVTDVRVDRLQNMTECDAEKEGCKGCPSEHPVYFPEGGADMCFNISGECTENYFYCNNSLPEAFGRDIWDSTIKPAKLHLYGWGANPWVWVIEFERCDKPEE